MATFEDAFIEFSQKQIDHYISEIADMCGSKSAEARVKLKSLVSMSEMKGAAAMTKTMKDKIDQIQKEEKSDKN